MERIKELSHLIKTQLIAQVEEESPPRESSHTASSHTTTDQYPGISPHPLSGQAVRPSHLLNPPHQSKMATTATVMEDVKDWLMTKCRDAGTLLTSDRHQSTPGGRLISFSNIVVTPENIPPFTIPRNDGAYHDRESQDSEGCSHSSDSLNHSCHTSPGHSPTCGQSSNRHLLPLPTVYSRSAPVSPCRSIDGRCASNLGKSLTGSDCKLEAANVDPFSLTALSLPHLKTKTDFGFEMLSESPHTRRKESLFHDNLTLKQSPRRRTTGSMDTLNTQDNGEKIIDVPRTSHTRRHKRRDVPSFIAPLGVVLEPHSQGRMFCPKNPFDSQLQPFSSCPEFSLPPVTRQCQTINMTSSCEPACHRRRLSLTDDKSSGHPDSDGSKFPRRGSNNFLLTPHDIDQIWSEASCHSSSTDLSSACSCNRSKCRLGNLRFSVQYLKKLRQIKVGVLRAENLGGSLRDTQDMNTLVKLHLMPGKLQKQMTKLVKQTRDPVYNEDFMFTGIEPHQVPGLKLHMKVYQKTSKLTREELLGEFHIALENFELANEIRILKSLEPPMCKQELGYIQLSVCFYASAEKLSLTIHQATDLPKQSFTGAPDPYVKVELHQPGRPMLRSQTKTKKKATTALYDETFTFNISPKIDDIKYTTLDISVLDHGVIRADATLGQIRLGYNATEESEFQHWNQVLQNPGKVITYWQMLMEVSEH